jgi:hypothetical protein
MTEIEHLLIIAAEECGEVAVRVSKALRFGLGEREPNQPFTNVQRIAGEFSDLIAVLEMITERGLPIMEVGDRHAIDAKKVKVATYLDYSESCGTLER